ncbi:hypothetical protein CRUP_007594 [Coryphaenoides rupestris]|nr:hypothetical protein CRUP_007594 [Coryphaenoides rupestris]
MGPALFWNFSPKAGCVAPPGLLQSIPCLIFIGQTDDDDDDDDNDDDDDDDDDEVIEHGAGHLAGVALCQRGARVVCWCPCVGPRALLSVWPAGPAPAAAAAPYRRTQLYRLFNMVTGSAQRGHSA